MFYESGSRYKSNTFFNVNTLLRHPKQITGVIVNKPLVVLISFLLIISNLSACNNNENLVDGDIDIEELETEYDSNENELDLDIQENEPEEDEVFVCSGSCTKNDSVCVGDNVCYCENGTWKLHDCNTVCSSDSAKTSAGCGPHADMDGMEYCICYMERIDGDEDYEPEPVCSGSCDIDTFEFKCVGNNSLCICDETTLELVEMDCNEICGIGDYCKSGSCEFNPNTGMDICQCLICPVCERDQDCVDQGKDFCVTFGDNSFCAYACDMNTCSDTVGCMDVGQGNGCGICFDLENADKCNADCPACEGDKVCTDVCGLYPDEPLCVETCEAAPNTCNAEETCLPLAIDSEGTIGERGACIAFSDLNCDTCGERGIDGDMENDIDSFLDGDFECQIDGDEDGEIEIEYDDDTEEEQNNTKRSSK